MVAATTSSCLPETKTATCFNPQTQTEFRCPSGWTCTKEQDACTDDDCGNGHLDPGEVCDDGNDIEGDGCSAHCQSIEICGNHIIDKAKGEQCDGGSNCSSNCKFLTCGNSIVDPGEDCDSGKETSGCTANCTFSICGDGYMNMVAGEQCDTGPSRMNTLNCNGPLCTIPICGDKFQNDAAGEECDNGSADTKFCNGSTGLSSCMFPLCGDGHVNMLFTPDGAAKTEEAAGSRHAATATSMRTPERPATPSAAMTPPCAMV